MRVRIDNVNSSNNGIENILVEFSSPTAKKVTAHWKSAQPETGNYYEVEIDIPLSLIWGESIAPTPIRNFQIYEADNRIHITGEIANINSESVAEFRHEQSVFFVEVDRIESTTPCFVKIAVPFIELWDVNI